MRDNRLTLTGSVVLVLVLGVSPGTGQLPTGASKGGQAGRPKAPFDEDKAILNEIKEAYKAPFEVHKDVLSELRRYADQPTPNREAKIISELRRLYKLTDRQEAAILREIQKVADNPSAEQQQRVFDEAEKAERLSEGAVPQAVQVEQSRKNFQRLDLNRDGVLTTDEMPAALLEQRSRWDRNRDQAIDADEYWNYYKDRLESLSRQIANGEIDLNLPRGAPAATQPPTRDTEGRLSRFRYGNLPPEVPSWFTELDTDRDCQVGLYEWVKADRSPDDFRRWDHNDDGFITVREVLLYLARQSEARPTAGSSAVGAAANGPGQR
jgi:Ca2+-binding EF-hand superfamily protein